MERTVELVGFDDGIGTGGGKQQVSAVVLGNSSEEGSTAYMRLVQQMGSHGAGCGLAVCTCHAQAFTAAGDDTQYLGTFMYLETIFAEVGQFGMFLRYGRGVDYQRACLVFARCRDKVDVFLVMYLCTLRNQTFGQVARRTVISGHLLSFGKEIAYQSAHTDAARTDEINGFDCFDIHYFN